MLRPPQVTVSVINRNQIFGFFSVPIEYRKRGVRFSASARLADFGVSAQFGVVDIAQRVKFYDMITTNTNGEKCINSDCPTITSSTTGTQALIYFLNPFPSGIVSLAQWTRVVDCVKNEVMNKRERIANAIGIDLSDYSSTSIEDLQVELFWRHITAINTKKCRGGNWPSFIFMPFVSAGGTIALANARDQNRAFSLSAGNNSHSTVRFNAGFTMDFYNSFEIGACAGFTHFNDKNFNSYRIPNNKYQNGMYPFKTRVNYRPGNTWHTSVFMNAYNYEDRFSYYAEYVWIAHNQDKITLLNPLDVKDLATIPTGQTPDTGDTKGFKPSILEDKTAWSVQVINTGLTWMASPNFTLGANCQIPIGRRNAYKSTTLGASIELIY